MPLRARRYPEKPALVLHETEFATNRKPSRQFRYTEFCLRCKWWSSQRPVVGPAFRNLPSASDVKAPLPIKHQIAFIECFDIAESMIPIRFSQHRSQQVGADRCLGRLCAESHQVPVLCVRQLAPRGFEMSDNVIPTYDTRPVQPKGQ